MDGVRPVRLKWASITPPDVAINFRRAREIGMRIPFALFEAATTIYDNEGKAARSATASRN